jgi:sugar phosphate isomerase/epimerase
MTRIQLTNDLAANLTSYYAFDLAPALAGVEAAGYRYVELTAIRGVVEHVPLEADAAAIDRTSRLLAKHGLRAIALAGHSDLTTEEGLRDGRLGVDLCERLGISLLDTAVGGAFNENEDEALFLAGIDDFAAYAEERGVAIGLEIHGTLTGTGRKACDLVEKVGCANVGVTYDTANCEYFGGVRPEGDLPEALPAVIHCHLKDKVGGARVWNFPALGEGHLDFARLLAAFAESDYAGSFSVEIEGQLGVKPRLDEINEAMRQSRELLAGLGLG